MINDEITDGPFIDEFETDLCRVVVYTKPGKVIPYTNDQAWNQAMFDLLTKMKDWMDHLTCRLDLDPKTFKPFE